MGTPFKMKGHTLPGIKQNPASPLRLEPVTIAAIIGAGVTAATAGAKGIAAKNKAKKDEKKASKDEAIAKSQSGADALASGEGSKTKLTDGL